MNFFIFFTLDDVIVFQIPYFTTIIIIVVVIVVMVRVFNPLTMLQKWSHGFNGSFVFSHVASNFGGVLISYMASKKLQ